MKILMISPQFRPIVGGYERSAERLSVGLAGRGHIVTVTAERRDRSWESNEDDQGVAVRRLWCIHRPRLHIITSLMSFGAFLVWRGRHFDLWHVHQYGLHAALCVALGKLLGKPVVLKLTSSGDEGLSKAVARTRGAPIVAALLRRVDAVVALTLETAREAVDFGVRRERIHTFGNGVDPISFRPRDRSERGRLRTELGLTATGVVVSVGRLVSAKNPAALLDAWSRVVRGLPGGWKLVYVGDGPLRDFLTRKVRAAGLQESVVLVGQQANISEWMGASDVYVSASNHEGLSNTLLEAMSCGLPVAVTRVSGTREVVENPGAGLAVDIGDVDALGRAIAALAYGDPLREQLGRRARAVIEEKYSIEAVVRRHELLYERLVNKTALTDGLAR